MPPDIREKLRQLLDSDRYEHSLRVEKVAVKLAQYYNVDIQKASIAGLLHDCAKYMSRSELLSKALNAGKNITPVERFEPKLLHSFLSSIMAKKEFGINDAEILGAIEKHTLGADKMTRLEEIIYLADHIEESRSYEGVIEIRELAYKDIRMAIAKVASAMITHLLKNNLPIEPTVINMRNAYLLWTMTE